MNFRSGCSRPQGLAPERPLALEISTLCKRYPNGVQALDSVSLSISPGLFGLLGPNGAGKSSLMRTLATLQEADSGSVLLDGIDVLRDKQRIRERLGYLPQDFGLYPKVTALALLDHLAVLKGLHDRARRRAAVEGLLRQVNLYEVRNERLGTFSGGMRQRFGIAQALLGNPRLIIVDEPTAGLDPEERVRFLNLLAELGENLVILLSTHIVDDVADLCRQAAILCQGRVVQAGEPEALVGALRGRVWRRFAAPGEFEAVKASHRVLATRRVLGRLSVRVHAEAPPGPGFEPAEPELEDVYFLAISTPQPA